VQIPECKAGQKVSQLEDLARSTPVAARADKDAHCPGWITG